MASSAFARVWLGATTGALLLAGTLGVGLRTDFLPCTLDCGETYEAHVAARNLWRFGWAHAGLQDFAANPSPSAHPALYIHNPNLGMYALAGLFSLGVRSIHAQTPWVALIFVGGLLYLYGAVRRVTRSPLLAWCCLLQALTLYLLAVLWQFDALRVWSWLLTWGVVYHLARWGESRRGSWHALALGACIALGIGVDYPFALFLAMLGISGAVLCVPPRIRLAAIGVIAAALVGAGLLRQLQVILAIGPALWWIDTTMTLVRRLPFTTAVAAAVDPASFALAHGFVVWPGGGGPPQPIGWLWVILRAYLAVVGWPLAILGLGWLWAVRHRARVEPSLRRALDLSLAVAVALSATFLVFGEYMAAFYGVYLMPLVVHWIVLVLGLTTWWLWTHRQATWRLGKVVLPVGLIALVGFGLWRVGTELRNVALLPPVGYPGRQALLESQGTSVATLWISSAPSAYTDQWAASLQTMRWLVQGPRGFTFEPTADYYAFFERDRTNPLYRQPDLLLVPRLRTWGLDRRCSPLGGAILGFADGCSDLSHVETALARLPLVRAGPDYLLYDLRVIRAMAAPTSKLDTVAPDGLSSGYQRTH